MSQSVASAKMAARMELARAAQPIGGRSVLVEAVCNDVHHLPSLDCQPPNPDSLSLHKLACQSRLAPPAAQPSKRNIVFRPPALGLFLSDMCRYAEGP